MNKLVYLFLFLAVFLTFYTQCYFAVPFEHAIVHTTLMGFTENILHAKLPVYLYDKIVNPADLLHTIFKYQYIYHVLSFSDSSLIKKNMGKYVIIYNDSDTDDTIVSILHPHLARELTYYQKMAYTKNFQVCNSKLSRTQKDTLVHVKIHPHNCIILPHAWVYNTQRDHILEIHLFDGMTAIRSIF